MAHSVGSPVRREGFIPPPSKDYCRISCIAFSVITMLTGGVLLAISGGPSNAYFFAGGSLSATIGLATLLGLVIKSCQNAEGKLASNSEVKIEGPAESSMLDEKMSPPCQRDLSAAFAAASPATAPSGDNASEISDLAQVLEEVGDREAILEQWSSYCRDNPSENEDFDAFINPIIDSLEPPRAFALANTLGLDQSNLPPVVQREAARGDDVDLSVISESGDLTDRQAQALSFQPKPLAQNYSPSNNTKYQQIVPYMSAADRVSFVTATHTSHIESVVLLFDRDPAIAGATAQFVTTDNLKRIIGENPEHVEFAVVMLAGLGHEQMADMKKKLDGKTPFTKHKMFEAICEHLRGDKKYSALGSVFGIDFALDSTVMEGDVAPRTTVTKFTNPLRSAGKLKEMLRNRSISLPN